MARASDKFSVANRLRNLHRFVQVLLSLLFFGGLNYFAIHHYARYDITRNHFFSLSPETRGYLAGLQKPVRIIVTVPENSSQPDEQQLYRYVADLLEQYRFAMQAAGNADLLEVEFVNLFQDLNRARELAAQYGLDQKNLIVVTTGTRTRFLTPAEIFEFEGLEAVAFKGEQALTSALVEVVTENQPRIYFTVGHGEMRLDNVDPTRGLTELAGMLAAKNFGLGHLDLSQESEVPDDADLVVVADPQGPFLPEEEEKLRRFLLEKSGRLALFLSPAREAGLDALLDDWGLRADDMIVLETGANFVGAAGSFLIRDLAPHPVTEALARNEVYLVSGPLRPLRPDAGSPLDDRLRALPLLRTSASSWAEAGYTSGGTPRYDEASDLPGPVTVGAFAERRSASQLGIEIVGGRLLAVGSGDLLANRRLTSAYGNQLFFFGGINWLLERDQVLALPPRPIEKYQLVISQGELQTLALLFLLIPGLAALLGLIVVWMRKF